MGSRYVMELQTLNFIIFAVILDRLMAFGRWKDWVEMVLEKLCEWRQWPLLDPKHLWWQVAAIKVIPWARNPALAPPNPFKGSPFPPSVKLRRPRLPWLPFSRPPTCGSSFTKETQFWIQNSIVFKRILSHTPKKITWSIKGNISVSEVRCYHSSLEVDLPPPCSWLLSREPPKPDEKYP